MDWKQRFYKNYVASHVAFLRPNQTSIEIKKNFSVWRKYYGLFLPKDKEEFIADIGCGSGELIYWLRSEGFRNVVGVESSYEQIEEAKKLGIVDIKQENLLDFLKNKENNFSCIIARDVLEHFDKKEFIEILDGIYKTLKPGGSLIVQTPNAESLFGSRYRYYDFTHDIGLTSSSLSQALRVAGFSEVKVFPMRPVVHGLKSLIRRILWQFIELMIYFCLLIESGSGKGIFTQNMIAWAKK